jgi:hypothetical protein
MRRFSSGRWPIACVSAGLGVLTCSSAFSGVKIPGQPVIIYDYYKLAIGSIAGARNSSDNVQFIGCNATTDNWGSVGNCVAEDATGLFRPCWTYDAGMIATIRAMKGDSEVEFEWDDNFYCTLVYTNENSMLDVKVP